MKTIKKIIILLFILPHVAYGENSDSLLEIQIQKTTKYYREVRNLANEIGSTNANLENYLNSIETINKKIDALESNILVNNQEIKVLNSNMEDNVKKRI